MHLYQRILITIAIAGLISGCEKNEFGAIDPPLEVPVLSNPSITPTAINVDNLTPANGLYTIAATISVKTTLHEHTGTQHVRATIFRPTGAEVATIILHDDGISPDQRSGDSVYSANIQFTLTRGQAGRYRIQFRSELGTSTISNLTDAALLLTRRNSAPVLTSVTTPDTIQLPTTDTLRVQFTAAVADSDGLGDVREVFFYRISPPDPTKFIMKDDGGLDREILVGGIPVKSGDDIAGDGRYSFLIPLTSGNTRRTSVFGFQAVDTFGDTSSTIQRTFTIR